MHFRNIRTGKNIFSYEIFFIYIHCNFLLISALLIHTFSPSTPFSFPCFFLSFLHFILFYCFHPNHFPIVQSFLLPPSFLFLLLIISFFCLYFHFFCLPSLSSLLLPMFSSPLYSFPTLFFILFLLNRVHLFIILYHLIFYILPHVLQTWMGKSKGTEKAVVRGELVVVKPTVRT